MTDVQSIVLGCTKIDACLTNSLALANGFELEYTLTRAKGDSELIVEFIYSLVLDHFGGKQFQINIGKVHSNVANLIHSCAFVRFEDTFWKYMRPTFVFLALRGFRLIACV